MSAEFSAAYLAEDRRQPAVIGIVVVTALSFIVVVIRLYARRILIRELGLDDLFILLAQVILHLLINCCSVAHIIHFEADQLGHDGTLFDDTSLRLWSTSRSPYKHP
jgi:hypothetical protein